HPEIALAVERRTVRKVEQPFAPCFEQFAVPVVFENRRLGSTHARVVGAAFDDVDSAVGSTLHRGDRRPLLDRRRQLTPVACCPVALWKIVSRSPRRLPLSGITKARRHNRSHPPSGSIHSGRDSISVEAVSALAAERAELAEASIISAISASSAANY